MVVTVAGVALCVFATVCVPPLFVVTTPGREGPCTESAKLEICCDAPVMLPIRDAIPV